MSHDGAADAVVHDLVVFGRELFGVRPELGGQVNAVGEAVDGRRLPLVQVHHLAGSDVIEVSSLVVRLLSSFLVFNIERVSPLMWFMYFLNSYSLIVESLN